LCACEKINHNIFCLQNFDASIKSLFQAKVEKLHKAIKDSDVEKVKEVLTEDASLVQYADRTGFPPLHKAVILGETTIAEHITKSFPDTLKTTDFVSN